MSLGKRAGQEAVRDGKAAQEFELALAKARGLWAFRVAVHLQQLCYKSNIRTSICLERENRKPRIANPNLVAQCVLSRVTPLTFQRSFRNRCGELGRSGSRVPGGRVYEYVEKHRGGWTSTRITARTGGAYGWFQQGRAACYAWSVAPAPNRCPADAEEIAESYIMGTLPDDDAAAFEEHLLVCGRCMAAVEAAEEYVRAMSGAARELR